MTHIYRHMHLLLAYIIFAINWSRISYIIMNHSMHVCMCISIMYKNCMYTCMYAYMHVCARVCVCVSACVPAPPHPPPPPPPPLPFFQLFSFRSRFSQPLLFESGLTKESDSEWKIYSNECKHLVSNKNPQWFAWRRGGRDCEGHCYLPWSTGMWIANWSQRNWNATVLCETRHK